MFDIGWSELLFLGVLAILVVGPKDLPRMMRVIGQYTGKIKAAAREFQRSFDEMARESELKELRKQIAEAKANNPIAQVKDAMAHPLDAVGRALRDPEAAKADDAPVATPVEPVTGPENSIGAVPPVPPTSGSKDAAQ